MLIIYNNVIFKLTQVKKVTNPGAVDRNVELLSNCVTLTAVMGRMCH